MIDRRTFAATLVMAAASAALPAAHAQDYPTQPLRWIVPYPAGGGSDAIARLIATTMQPGYGQPIIVENRAGASTNIAAEAIAAAKPDGTMVMSADNASIMFNPFIFDKLKYDPAKDFSYVGGIGRFAMVLVVHPGQPVRSVAEFVALAKASPGKISFASPGTGSAHHVSLEMFRQRAGIVVTHVPYRGAAPAMQDLMGGQVEAMMLDLAAGLGAMRSGKVRPIAIAAPTRAAALPDVPTMAEAGIGDIDAYAYQGVIAPANLPAAVLSRLNRDLNVALSAPAVTQRLREFGAELMIGTPQQMRDFVTAERARWSQVIKAAGIKLE